jgi:hypothetical protein
MDGDVRVSVLVRSAHGVPEDCRTYVKVSCGGKTHKTPFLTGVRPVPGAHGVTVHHLHGCFGAGRNL